MGLYSVHQQGHLDCFHYREDKLSSTALEHPCEELQTGLYNVHQEKI